ncbi:MAG: hypothetical protein O2981_09745 [Proteobacteria bacterium]|nr:hypothetical protein [Pseudomonadota bacterium]
MTLGELIEAFLVSGGVVDVSGHGRLQFWRDELGDRDITAITADDVDACLVRLAQRGRLRAGRNMETRPTGKPLAKSTISRYLGTLGGNTPLRSDQHLKDSSNKTAAVNQSRPLITSAERRELPVASPLRGACIAGL